MRLIFDHARIPRTTTRQQWREIDRWRRNTEKTIWRNIQRQRASIEALVSTNPELAVQIAEQLINPPLMVYPEIAPQVR